MPVQEIRNVRDLLVHTIGTDLAEAHNSGRLRTRYPALTMDEATVAWVLDGMTRHSLDLLMKLREAEGWQ